MISEALPAGNYIVSVDVHMLNSGYPSTAMFADCTIPGITSSLSLAADESDG